MGSPLMKAPDNLKPATFDQSRYILDSGQDGDAKGQEFKYPLCCNWMMKAKSLKKLLKIKDIRSWLPPGLDGRKVCSHEAVFFIAQKKTPSSHDTLYT